MNKVPTIRLGRDQGRNRDRDFHHGFCGHGLFEHSVVRQGFSGSRLRAQIARQRPNASVAARQRCPTLRQQRRRRGLIKGLLAVLVLIGAWDLACRIDEVPYNHAVNQVSTR
jgi:hypothetical protein